MEQHPVPQQISSYEFRLVGDMTLKQFGQVAGGVVAALIIYTLPFPGYLKWPFIVIFALTGAAMAFMPIEERPLQTWIIAFLRAAYSPTQFLWQKKGQRPAFFEDVGFKPAPPVNMAPVSQPSQKKLDEYLSTLSESQVLLEKEEIRFIDRIQNLFSAPWSSTTYTPPPKPAEPKPEPKPEPKVEPKEEQIPTANVRMPLPKEFFEKLAETPATPVIDYHPPLATNFRVRERIRTAQAQFSSQVPMPSVPEIPNILVGMVSDTSGMIVEGAIIEIRDSQGNPVRALRTNKLGQFRIVNPLANDTYEVEIEKDGYHFDTFKVELKGEIMEPLDIRAKDEPSIVQSPSAIFH